jgi:hypothetical protein
MGSGFSASNPEGAYFSGFVSALGGYGNILYISAAGRFKNSRSLPGPAGKVLNLANMARPLNAVYNNGGISKADRNARYSRPASQTAVASFVFSPFNFKPKTRSSLAYAKYRFSTQRLGLTSASHDLFDTKPVSPAQNSCPAGALPSSLLSNTAVGTYQKFIDLNSYMSAFLKAPI